MLYIFWFLHQTTTIRRVCEGLQGCISFDSYIKPQLLELCIVGCGVVYLLIPTSNHNQWVQKVSCLQVVYLLIPTSNHNLLISRIFLLALYIFWFLHQTTTLWWMVSQHQRLYIFWFLHQTTTCPSPRLTSLRCISFDSYIKPQLGVIVNELTSVVYLLIPTSNHNLRLEKLRKKQLYIFWFLHQTTTVPPIGEDLQRCISFDSYIKPQPIPAPPTAQPSCISFDSYIKPQHSLYRQILRYVVYLLIPTSNHNYSWISYARCGVVYLLIPTSNHNSLGILTVSLRLYIFWFLHQTTTCWICLAMAVMLYIFWFLHQTTTLGAAHRQLVGCISFDSYIKPQQSLCILLGTHVVYLLIPTSNHNKACAYCLVPMLYIFWFLHQTTTFCPIAHAAIGCISFDSYIKPQLQIMPKTLICVVYLLIPTSNHNLLRVQKQYQMLYIFWSKVSQVKIHKRDLT